MLIPLGAWLPDQPLTDLADCKNAYPMPEGYSSVGSFAPFTAALGGKFVGGGAFVGPDGTAALLAATPSGLFKYSSGWSSVYATSTSTKWHFCQFGNNIIAANGGQLISYNMSAATAALISGAPSFSDVATVRDFIFGIKKNGDRLLIQWSGFNDSTGWTVGTNQSDEQPLLSGGEAMRVIGGEWGTVLQKNAIQRFTYVGGDVIFQRDEISAEIGCMAAGSVQKVGTDIFFLSERGFMKLDAGGQITPIGEEKVNRTFFAAYPDKEIEDGISVAVDPNRPIVMWSMPGNPGAVWAYNYALDRWSKIEVSCSAVFTAFTANVSLEGVDAIYPGGIDTVPGSLDDAMFSGGNPILIVVNSSNTLGTLTGPALGATFELPWMTPAGENLCRVRSMRGVGDAVFAGSIDCRLKLTDPIKLVSAIAARNNGRLPIRCNGRWLKPKLTTSGAFSVVKALELELAPAGER